MQTTADLGKDSNEFALRLSAAKCNYSTETLCDAIVSCPHEEIKEARNLIANSVKDIIRRRGPDNNEDLQDVLTPHDEFLEYNLKLRFMADSHKTLLLGDDGPYRVQPCRGG